MTWNHAENLTGATEDLAAHLRRATAGAHQRLEASLDLLAHLSDAAATRRLLGRFLGFHRVWEPALARRPAVATFHEHRRRLPQLEADLKALGCSQAMLAALPLCDAAGELTATDARALGSLYVMEGSTLGGQVINRALKDAPWRPAQGLTYFDPYGVSTGAMWRGFKAWSGAHPAAADREGVTEGALKTFDLLQTWLPT